MVKLNTTIEITLDGTQGWFNVYIDSKGVSTDNICHIDYTTAHRNADESKCLEEILFFKRFPEILNVTYCQTLKK